MEKDSIKLLIAEYQRKVSAVSLLERPFHLEDSLNYVFFGLPRAGKSYLLYQQIRHLLRSGHGPFEILYFNFADDRIPSPLSLPDLDTIKLCYEEMYPSKPFFFLDELPLVPQWEKFACRMADQGYRLYIAGSTAFLSDESAALLDGRFMMQKVYPFSFAEYLSSQGIDLKDKNAQFPPELLKAFEAYFRFGGLPELLPIQDKRSWLSTLYQRVFLGDLLARHRLRHDGALRILLKEIAAHISFPLSFNRLANLLSAAGTKISCDTVIDYVHYLSQGGLLYPLENYSAAVQAKESNKKYYFSDNGLLHLFLLNPLPSLLENQVAIHLSRFYGGDLYYFCHLSCDVDFYVPGPQLAIQVCYSLKNDPHTSQLKLKALSTLPLHAPVKTFLLITNDDQEVRISINGRSISVIPIWKWLLSSTPSDLPLAPPEGSSPQSTP